MVTTPDLVLVHGAIQRAILMLGVRRLEGVSATTACAITMIQTVRFEVESERAIELCDLAQRALSRAGLLASFPPAFRSAVWDAEVRACLQTAAGHVRSLLVAMAVVDERSPLECVDCRPLPPTARVEAVALRLDGPRCPRHYSPAVVGSRLEDEVRRDG